jgi:tetratricopeptide (TPR) repeat protein
MRRRGWIRLIAGLAVFFIALVAGGSAAAQTRIRAPYLDIVWDYRDGNYQQAIDAVAALPVDGLRERVFGDLDTAVQVAMGGGMRKMSEGQRFSVVKIWATLTPVAALLHIEAGYQLLQKGNFKAGVQHLLLARLLADWDRWRFILEYLPDEGKKLAYKKLRRDVYLTIAWMLQSAVEEATLAEHLTLARKNLPDEAEIWLASGSAEELLAEPSMLKRLDPSNKRDTRFPRDTWEMRMRERFLEKAEEYHREAIARDPALAEAHVRLGRVLQQRGKLADARAALEAARRLESPSEVGYLATLFLAGVIEEANRPEEKTPAANTPSPDTAAPAFDMYTELVERWPECQSGHLGLSRAYSARGNGPAALDALKPLWKEPEHRACFDSWWVYRSGQAWRLKALLQALRERVVS